MKKFLLFVSCIIAFKNTPAQTNKSNNIFNEQSYIDQARSIGYNAEEIKNYVERSRKQFVDGNTNTINTNNKPSQTYTYNPGCTNIDFETGNAIGWAVSSGSNPIVNGSCSLLGCCPGSLTNYTIMSNGVVDPNVPTFTINSVFGAGGGTGNFFAKINDAIPNFAMERMSQSFKVTAANNLFVYAFLLVFDGTGHVCCDQPFYNLTLQDTLGNLIVAPTMPNYSVTVPGLSCPAVPSLSLVTGGLLPAGNFSYTPWIISAIDLTPYIGNAVNISVTAGDCTGGAHAGYMYYDAMCAPLTYTDGVSPMTLNQVNNLILVGSKTLVAPKGFNSYQWNGPTGTINSPTLTTSTFGTYTLSLGGIGYSGYSQKVFSLMPSGINEINPKMDAINIFPNPTNNEFYIDNLPLKSTYSVTDVSGKLILSKTLNAGGKAKIEMNNAANGIYFVKVETELGIKNFKIVKE